MNREVEQTLCRAAWAFCNLCCKSDALAHMRNSVGADSPSLLLSRTSPLPAPGWLFEDIRPAA